MNRRKFLHLFGCSCFAMGIHSCTTAPITERKQLNLIPEAKLNAQAADIYKQVKKKEKMSDDKEQLEEIIQIGKRMEKSISEYFSRVKGDKSFPSASYNASISLVCFLYFFTKD